MLGYGLDCVLAASRLIATGGREVGGDGSLVESDKENHQSFHTSASLSPDESSF